MKFKKITNDYLITFLDKYSRFEPANLKIAKLYNDVVSKFLIDTQYKPYSDNELIECATEIINDSFLPCESDDNFNKIFRLLEEKYFIKNDLSYQYLSTRLNISSMLDKIQIITKTPQNVVWLKYLKEYGFNLASLRQKYGLLYPIEKIILCEGETEHILLNSLFLLFNIDLNKLGYKILPAGGKNQVARKYYEMLEYIKLPICILLDSDAEQTKSLIEPKLRSIDKLYLIKSGEFEDLIPIEILVNTINSVHEFDYNCTISDYKPSLSAVENLENIYKKYGYGEFKKALFAKQLNEYILNNTKLLDFNGSEIMQIVNYFCND